MKILHTSDLHLGRQFNGLPLDDDHAAVLDQIAIAASTHAVDALIIAGDIFDRAAPPASAVRQLNAFLARITSETNAAVIMIAGNHDSGDRIASMSVMDTGKRALIRGVISVDEKPLLLADAHGTVAFSGLPFAYEYAARECFADEALQTPQDVVAAQIAAARRHLPDGVRWVVVSHAFVAGSTASDSERSLVRVGGIETIGPDTYDGAHYVALGHLHRPQSAGAPHIHYSGSPLAFGFDEADSVKSMNLVEIDAAGTAKIDPIAFKPRRRVRALMGKHAELLLANPSDDFIKIVLTDETPVIDAMKRLRDVFPNACELVYAREERAAQALGMAIGAPKTADPAVVINDFLQLVRDQGITESEKSVVGAALDDMQKTEDAA
jgi:exonuclease SbcD